MLLGRKLSGNDNDPNARDVPRNSPSKGEDARALIGDPRNDENVIVSQLQASWLRFHNRLDPFVGRVSRGVESRKSFLYDSVSDRSGFPNPRANMA